MSLSFIPAAALLLVILLTNPSADNRDEKPRYATKKQVRFEQLDPLIRVEEPKSDDMDYEAILTYITSTFKTIDQEDAESISQSLVEYGKQFDLDPKFAAAVVARESAFKKEAVSSTGAKGLGQIKDFNYPSLGISDPFNITENIKGTTQYLKKMLSNWQKTKEDYKEKMTAPEEKNYKDISQSEKVKLALASYYKGFTAVKNDNGTLDTKTKGYVGDILDYYNDITSIRDDLEKEK